MKEKIAWKFRSSENTIKYCISSNKPLDTLLKLIKKLIKRGNMVTK